MIAPAGRLAAGVRASRADECDLLGSIAREAKAHWGYAPAQIDAWRRDLVVTRAQITQGVAVVAEAGGQPCGFSIALPGDRWELEHLWVRPAAIRSGIGRLLLEQVCAPVRARGGAAVRIVADPFAAAFYVRLGALPAGRVAAPIAGSPARELPVFLLASNRSPVA